MYEFPKPLDRPLTLRQQAGQKLLHVDRLVPYLERDLDARAFAESYEV